MAVAGASFGRSLLTKPALASLLSRSVGSSSSSSPLSRLRHLLAVNEFSRLPVVSAARHFSSRPATSSLNDPSPNWSNRPPKETILLDGCDFEHWLVVMEKPEENATRDEIIDSYIKTLAQIVGSEEEARKKIYSVSTRCYFAFGCLVSEELSYKIKELPRVRWVLPDSYLDVKNKDYGGEPFIDGKAVPYDPKYHEEWIRNNARANERSRRNDRPRNFDRSRNFERRRENMMNRDVQSAPPPMSNMQSSVPPGPGVGGAPSSGASGPNPGVSGAPSQGGFPSGGQANSGFQNPNPSSMPNSGFQNPNPSSMPNSGYQNPNPSRMPSSGFPNTNLSSMPDSGLPNPNPSSMPNSGFPNQSPGTAPSGYYNRNPEGVPGSGFQQQGGVPNNSYQQPGGMPNDGYQNQGVMPNSTYQSPGFGGMPSNPAYQNQGPRAGPNPPYQNQGMGAPNAGYQGNFTNQGPGNYQGHGMGGMQNPSYQSSYAPPRDMGRDFPGRDTPGRDFQ